MAPKNKIDVFASKETSFLFLFSSIRLNYIVYYCCFLYLWTKEPVALPSGQSVSDTGPSMACATKGQEYNSYFVMTP